MAADRLIARASFFQLDNLRKGPPPRRALAPIVHENVLIFRAPTKCWSSEKLMHAQREPKCSSAAIPGPGTWVSRRTLARDHRLPSRFPGPWPRADQMIQAVAAVGLAVSAAVLLVTSYVGGGLAAGLITAFVACLFGLLWFVFPLARRH